MVEKNRNISLAMPKQEWCTVCSYPWLTTPLLQLLDTTQLILSVACSAIFRVASSKFTCS